MIINPYILKIVLKGGSSSFIMILLIDINFFYPCYGIKKI